MPIALARSFLPLPLLLMLPAPLTAQEAPATPPVVTQQEQNELRARAFRAENEGRYAAAAEAFLALSRAEPQRLDWIIAAGRCLGRAGRFADAIDLLDAANRRLPDAHDVVAMLARTLLLQTEREPGMPHPEVNWTTAAELTERVLQADPDHEDARLLLAQTRYLLGDRDAAVAAAEEAVRRHPERPGAHVLIGRIASDRFRELLDRYGRERPEGQAQADLVAAIDRERKQARGSFERAAGLDPTRAYPHVALSQLATLDGKPDAARRHLIDALAIDPDTPADHGLLTRGLDWQARRDLYRDLIARFTRDTGLPDAIRDAKTATLRFHEGRAELDGGDYAAAKQSFRSVCQLNPAAKNAHYYAFLAAYHLGQHDDAELEASTYARAGAPAFADVLRALPAQQRAEIGAIVQYLGDRAFQQQRIENSRDLNHVIACLKDSADAWNNHAFLCRETGRFEDAFTSYQYAIEREPESPQLWNDAGVVLQYHLPTADNLKKARGMYERALELAAKVLADVGASAAARDAARTAEQNARANLAELSK